MEMFPRGKLRNGNDDGKDGAQDGPVHNRQSGNLFGRPTKRIPSRSKSEPPKKGTHKLVEKQATIKQGQDTLRRCDELSFKRLTVGTTVLCRVRRVGMRQLVLALPHNMTGYCATANTNDAIFSAISAEAASEHAQDDVSEGSEELKASREGGGKPGLTDFFRPGQYVLGTISKIGSDKLQSSEDPRAALAASLIQAPGSGKGAKRIEVTLRPEVCNKGCTLAQLKTGSLLYGHIRSIEDHGYVVTTGIPGCTAFLPLSGSDATVGQFGVPLNRQWAGSPVFAMVASLNRNSASITLSCNAARVATAESTEVAHTIYTVKPGMLVTARVSQVLPNGLATTFLAFFRASMHMNHLPQPAHALWESRYKPETDIKARILYVDVLNKVIGISGAPHVVSLGDGRDCATECATGCGIGGPAFDVGDGTVVEKATVLRVDPTLGMLVGWDADMGPDKRQSQAKPPPLETRVAGIARWGRTAYVHISRMTDKRIEHVGKMYRPGSAVKVRVIGFAGIEGCALAATKPSIVDAAVLRLTDVQPGALVMGTVVNVLVEPRRTAEPPPIDLSTGKGVVAVVRLGEGINALVPALHVADVLPVRSFASARGRRAFLKGVHLEVGKQIQARVTSVNRVTGKILVSLKRTLLASPHPILVGFQKAAEELAAATEKLQPLLTHGCVTTFTEKGIVVSFYGEAYGFLPVSDLVDNHLISPEAVVRAEGPGAKPLVKVPLSALTDLYSLGQPIQVRVASVKPQKRKIGLSMNYNYVPPKLQEHDTPVQSDAPAVGQPLPDVGTFVDVEVESRDDANGRLLVKLANGGCLAELPYAHLSDHPTLCKLLASSPDYLAKPCRLLVLQRKEYSHRHPGDPACRPAVLLTAKPYLHFAAVSGNDMLPSTFEVLRPGLIVIGYVASITAFGAFIRFMNGLTGMVPLGKSPRMDAGMTHALSTGQTVLGVVEKVADNPSERNGHRFTLSLLSSAVSKFLPQEYIVERRPLRMNGAVEMGATGTSLLLQSYLLQEEMAGRSDDNDHLKMSRALYPPGSYSWARVQHVSDDGVTVQLPSPQQHRRRHLPEVRRASQEVSMTVGFALAAARPSDVSVGAIVPIRVLDVDLAKCIVNVSIERAVPECLHASTLPATAKRARSGASGSHAAPSTLPARGAYVVPPAAPTNIRCGDIVEAEILFKRPGAPYVVVQLPSCGHCVAYAATGDLVSCAADDTLSVGSTVPVVVTNPPRQQEVDSLPGKKVDTNKSGDRLEAAVAAVETLCMVSVAPCTVSSSKGHIKEGMRVDSGRPSAKPTTSMPDVDTLVPGMPIHFVAKSAKTRQAEPGGQPHDHSSQLLGNLNVRLVDVRGSYTAHISACELVDVCPYTGQSGVSSLQDTLEAIKLGEAMPAKVCSVTTTTDAASGKSVYHLELTVRDRDLALAIPVLASPRCAWGTVVHPIPRLSPPAQAVESGGPGCIYLPALYDGAHPLTPLSVGGYGFGVVEGFTADRSYIWIGLGGAVHARCFVLDAADDDKLRDPRTGALIVTAQTSQALSPDSIPQTHKVGSTVPFVITMVDPEHHHVDVSIRKARSAMRIAAEACTRITEKSLPTVVDKYGAATKAVAAWLQEDPQRKPAPGTLVLARAFQSRVQSTADETSQAQVSHCSVRAQLANHTYGMIDATHLADRKQWQDYPASNFATPRVVVAVVLPPSPKAEAGTYLDLSLRPSCIALVHTADTAKAAGSKKVKAPQHGPTNEALARLLAAESTAAVEVGTPVSGFVVNTTSKGCFVKIARDATARVLLSRLSSRYVKDPAARFPPGKLVTGKIVAAEPALGRCDMSLKESDLASDLVATGHGDDLLSWDDLRTGAQFAGRVTKVADFGVFVELDGTTRDGRAHPRDSLIPISGLCHVSEIEDGTGIGSLRQKLGEKFSVSDRVRVVIVHCDADKKKLSLSMKASRLASLEGEPKGTSGDHLVAVQAGGDRPVSEDSQVNIDTGDIAGAASDDSVSVSSEEHESGNSEGPSRRPGSKRARIGVFDHLQTDDEETPEELPTARHTKAVTERTAPITWDASIVQDDHQSLGSSAGSSDDEQRALSKNARRRQRRREQAAEEAETRRKELRIATGEADRDPETEEDFERLVLAEPNNSMVWIRYMAWQLSVTEIDKARAVAERALTTVSYREEEHKFNVWTAYMNLEAVYGDAASLGKVFARAQAACDPKAVHYALLGVYQRQGRDRSAETEALFGIAARKFGKQFKKVWHQWAAFRFRQGDAAGARALLQKALAVLCPQKHISLKEHFALLEYKFATATGEEAVDRDLGLGRGRGSGSQERGRTLLEGILASNPKRLDIWNVYLDQEISSFRRRYTEPTSGSRAGDAREDDLAVIRRLFDRVLTLRLSAKKMKFLFTKYAKFEKAYGDDAGFRKVHQLVKDYVARELVATEGAQLEAGLAGPK